MLQAASKMGPVPPPPREGGPGGSPANAPSSGPPSLVLSHSLCCWLLSSGTLCSSASSARDVALSGSRGRCPTGRSSGIFQNCPRQEDSPNQRKQQRALGSSLFLKRASSGTRELALGVSLFLVDSGVVWSDKLTSQMRTVRLREEM